MCGTSWIAYFWLEIKQDAATAARDLTCSRALCMIEEVAFREHRARTLASYNAQRVELLGQLGAKKGRHHDSRNC